MCVEATKYTHNFEVIHYKVNNDGPRILMEIRTPLLSSKHDLEDCLHEFLYWACNYLLHRMLIDFTLNVNKLNEMVPVDLMLMWYNDLIFRKILLLKHKEESIHYQGNVTCKTPCTTIQIPRVFPYIMLKWMSNMQLNINNFF